MQQEEVFFSNRIENVATEGSESRMEIKKTLFELRSVDPQCSKKYFTLSESNLLTTCQI